MSLEILLLILTSVSLSSFAQIAYKTGLSQPRVVLALDGASRLSALSAVLFNVWVVGGLALYFIAAVVWLLVLARIEVSMAYPFVGVGFILTMILGKFMMDDSISPMRVLGTLLISVGVVLVAWQ